MRSITKRRFIWILFVIVLVWFLAFVTMQYFLPELVEVPEFDTVVTIKEAVSSGVALGTLATLLVLIIIAIIVDIVVKHKQEY